MSTEPKTRLVPKLRFPEFLGTAGWTPSTLGMACDMQAGKFVAASNISECHQTGLFPCYGGNGLRGYTQTHTHDGTYTLIGRQGALCGNVRLAHEQFHATEHAVVATPRTGIDVGWLYYSLDLLNLNRFATGQAQPGLSVDVLENVALAISPLAAEQQKIADCLSSLDELIAAQARKVEALKTHKKGLMQQLFPREGETQPGLRFSEFESLGEWSALTIQELIDKHFIVGHLDGNHGSLYPRADEFSGSGVPYISATNFNNGGIDFERCKYLPVERAAQFKKGIARDGDILFAHNATVGPVAKLTMKYDFVILSTSLTYFRCNGVLLLNDFLKCALVSPAFVDQCARVMAQSTRNQIPITTQRTFGMQIPKLPEQQRIADCLNSLNDLITASIQELDTLKIHKEGLMQQLFPSVEMIEQ